MTEFNTPKHSELSVEFERMDLVEKILGPDEFKGFLKNNTLRYLILYTENGRIEDLENAMNYVKRLVWTVESEEEE